MPLLLMTAAFAATECDTGRGPWGGTLVDGTCYRTLDELCDQDRPACGGWEALLEHDPGAWERAVVCTAGSEVGLVYRPESLTGESWSSWWFGHDGALVGYYSGGSSASSYGCECGSAGSEVYGEVGQSCFAPMRVPNPGDAPMPEPGEGTCAAPLDTGSSSSSAGGCSAGAGGVGLFLVGLLALLGRKR